LFDFKFLDSPIMDRFISPAPGQSNMRMGKQIVTNENKQYFSLASRNNSVALPTVTGPIKKIGTLGLFFRKVSKSVIIQFSFILKKFNFCYLCSIVF